MRSALLYYLAQTWTADRHRPSVMHRPVPQDMPATRGHPGVPTVSAGSRP